jgi:hypothetical protein
VSTCSTSQGCLRRRPWRQATRQTVRGRMETAKGRGHRVLKTQQRPIAQVKLLIALRLLFSLLAGWWLLSLSKRHNRAVKMWGGKREKAQDRSSVREPK